MLTICQSGSYSGIPVFTLSVCWTITFGNMLGKTRVMAAERQNFI